MRILVVEDDKKIASFIQKGMQDNGFEVDIAPDGMDARRDQHLTQPQEARWRGGDAVGPAGRAVHDERHATCDLHAGRPGEPAPVNEDRLWRRRMPGARLQRRREEAMVA